MWENNEKINIDSTNIFDEFSVDEKTKEEVKKVEESKKRRWMNYYLYISNNLLSTINLIAFLFLIAIWWYIYFQNSKIFKDVSYLNPICNLFIHNKKDWENCYSVSYWVNNLQNLNNKKEKDLYFQNRNLIEKIYRNFKFIDSKDIRFLISKSQDRLKVLKILSEFDRIKNEFSPLNKTRLECSNISINSDYTVNINCSAFSWKWDSKILGYSGDNKWQDKVEWTSISIASSFINFLEKRKDSNFIVLDKPKKFNYVSIINDNGYTRKTDFKLKLKYNNNIWLNK